MVSWSLRRIAMRVGTERGVVYIAAIVAAVGGLIFGYDLNIMSGALIFIIREWDRGAGLGTARGMPTRPRTPAVCRAIRTAAVQRTATIRHRPRSGFRGWC